MPPLSSAPRPLCFVAMPFRKKAAPGTAPGPVWIPLVPCLTGKSWGRAGWRPYWTGAVKRWQVISLSIEAPAHFTRAAVGPISSVRSTRTNGATSTTDVGTACSTRTTQAPSGTYAATDSSTRTYRATSASSRSVADGTACLTSACYFPIMCIAPQIGVATGQSHEAG